MTCLNLAGFIREGMRASSQRIGDSDLSASAGLLAYILPLVKNSALFGGVSNSDLVQLLATCYLKIARANEYLYRADALPESIFLVVSGRVKLCITTDGVEYTKEVLMSGSVFGETALLGIQPHSDSAICLETAEILVLPNQVLSQLHQDNLPLFTLLLMNLSRDMSRRLIHHDRLYSDFHSNRLA